MYFQQIFWCVYDTGSDLAGDRPFLKRQIIWRPEHWPKHLFQQKWRQEGGKRETKKGGHSRWKKSRWQWHCLSPNLKSRKFASCLCLSFEVNLWIGIRKKTIVLDSVVNNVFENKPYIHWHFFCFYFCLYQDAAICLHIQNTVINTNRRLKREHQLNLPNQEYGQLR